MGSKFDGKWSSTNNPVGPTASLMPRNHPAVGLCGLEVESNKDCYAHADGSLVESNDGWLVIKTSSSTGILFVCLFG